MNSVMENDVVTNAESLLAVAGTHDSLFFKTCSEERLSFLKKLFY